MSADTTQTLIDRLAADAKARGKVQRWAPAPFTFFAIAASVVAVGIALVVGGKPLDWPHGDGALVGWWSMAAAGVLFVVATAATMRLAVPGRAVGTTLRYFAVLSTVVLCVCLGAHGVPAGATWSAGLSGGWACSASILFFAVAPLAMLAIALRTGAPVQLARTARWAALAALALGLLATDLVCPSEHPAHLLVFHGGAALVVGTVATLLLRRGLRW